MYWQGCWLCLYLFMRGDLVNRERIKKFVGGQAVIEGVMMRGPGYTATAVREPAGTIVVQKEATKSIADTYPILKKPDRKSTRLNSSHVLPSRMPSSA